MTRVLSLVVLATALLAGPAATRAEDAPAKVDAAQAIAFKQRVFGPAAGDKTFACFTRRYDADHLARHPQQKVASMKLLVKFEVDEQPHAPPYSFKLGFNYRQSKIAWETGGTCGLVSDEASGESVGMGCGVDCDGGGIGVVLAKDKDAVTVSLQRVRTWQRGKEDDESGGALVAGADDKSFRLDRASLRDCADLATDRGERLALRGK